MAHKPNEGETPQGWIVLLLLACAALIVWATVTGGLRDDQDKPAPDPTPQSSCQP